jgi:hypothetical protein
MAATVVVLPFERAHRIGWLGKINFISCSRVDSRSHCQMRLLGRRQQQNSAGEKLFIGGGDELPNLGIIITDEAMSSGLIRNADFNCC